MTRNKVFAPNEGITEVTDNLYWIGLIVRRSIKQSKVTVGGTAVVLPTTPLSNRKVVIIMNNSTSGQILYIGNSSVTTLDGFPIYPRAVIQFNIEDYIDIYGVASAAGAEIRILEGA